MTSIEYITKVLPYIKDHFADKSNRECEDAFVEVYWVGASIVRIDVAFKEEEVASG